MLQARCVESQPKLSRSAFLHRGDKTSDETLKFMAKLTQPKTTLDNLSLKMAERVNQCEQIWQKFKSLGQSFDS